jgi:hypothetical protein
VVFEHEPKAAENGCRKMRRALHSGLQN